LNDDFSVIEDPLAAFEKLLMEKEERDRARKKREIDFAVKESLSV
jgi:hypothetical protein